MPVKVSALFSNRSFKVSSYVVMADIHSVLKTFSHIVMECLTWQGTAGKFEVILSSLRYAGQFVIWAHFRWLQNKMSDITHLSLLTHVNKPKRVGLQRVFCSVGRNPKTLCPLSR